MPICLCCKKNEATIKIYGHWIISVCGQSECRTPRGQTLGEWFMDETDYGEYSMIRDLEEFSIEINHKIHIIKNDGRIVKGLHNKIRDIILGRA